MTIQYQAERRATVTCDPCGASADVQIEDDGREVLPEGWREIAERDHACPACSGSMGTTTTTEPGSEP